MGALFETGVGNVRYPKRSELVGSMGYFWERLKTPGYYENSRSADSPRNDRTMAFLAQGTCSVLCAAEV